MNTKDTGAFQLQIITLVMTLSFYGGTNYGRQVTHKIDDANFVAPKIHWEFNWSSQWDPRLIKFIREELLIWPPKYSNRNLNLVNEYDPVKPWMHQGENGEALAVEYLYGLDTIDKRIGHNLLDRRPRFFIEAGALDGERTSNTVYLELKYNWTGLLVEPNPAYLRGLLRKNRNVWIFPYCLSPFPFPTVIDFDAAAECGGIINYAKGIKKAPGNINHNYTSAYLGPSWRKTLQIQCFPLYSVLQALDLPTVDYFSLDIEGAEYPVLKSIPFKKVDIRMFGVEVEHAGKIFNGTEKDIIKLLKTSGYQYVAKTKLDKFFMKDVGNTLDRPLPISVQPII